MDEILQTVVNTVLEACAEQYSTSSTSSSDTDEDALYLEVASKRKKIENYVKLVVPEYTESVFQEHFRLTRTSVQLIGEDIGSQWLSLRRPKVDFENALLLSLWTLANQESFRGVADRFGVSQAHVHRSFIDVCKLLYLVRKKYIKWPVNVRQKADEFSSRKKNKFPNVIGCVDCTHIAIPGKLNDNSYYNRKGYSSIILQAVCDVNLKFVDVYIGWPGSVHDARVWKSSPLYHALKHSMVLEKDFHLLGDSAYPLDLFLMKPYRDNGHLLAKEIFYNKCLSSVRIVIEQAFGKLKNSFRRLKYLHVTNLKYAKFIITAACILHNVIAEEKEEMNEAVQEYMNDTNEFETEQCDNSEANLKRNEIANYLFENCRIST